jgi:predicted permease
MAPLAALEILAPVFALIACGFAAGRMKLFDEAAFRAIGRFVMLFALPATIFNAIAARPFRDIFEPRYLAIYGAASLASFALAYAFFLWARPRPASERAILGLGAAAANTGFIGYPVALQALGPVAGAAAGLTFLIENLIVIPLALILAEHGAAGGASFMRALGDAARRVASLPLIWAVAAGFAFSSLGLELPELAQRPIALLAGASAPAALFFVGGVLSALDARTFGEAPVALVACKLLAHPLAVWVLLQAWPLANPTLGSAALIFAAAPVVTIYPLLGQKFGLERENSVFLMLSTLAAALTLPAALWLLALPRW